MKIEKLNLEGKKSSVEVKDSIFSSKINEKLISSVIYKTNANYKGRSSKTKQKNEIIGSTSKIYAQKGTGNARHASRKAPIFVGGGIAHGPKGRNSYKTRKLNKNEKRQSISSILSKKLKQAGVDLIDCSSGGNYFDQEIELKKGYQVPLSKSIKSQAEILTGTVGLITENDHAEEILNNNEADAIFLGRELLRNPYWSLYSQEDIKAWPLQYQRSFESIGNIKYVRKND